MRFLGFGVVYKGLALVVVNGQRHEKCLRSPCIFFFAKCLRAPSIMIVGISINICIIFISIFIFLIILRNALAPHSCFTPLFSAEAVS